MILRKQGKGVSIRMTKKKINEKKKKQMISKKKNGKNKNPPKVPIIDL